ncbi:6-hydroxymethylpterin diphosphokinase MptE-like protein [Phosphitispora sp. TUW77]|uniref:motility associated factor glycosyltransferase family protein n=1 Tax=Phosphitispora sp. TUW77 TaxID=3152361 RepID=UPI003AB20EB0
MQIIPEKARSGLNTARVDNGSRKIYLHSKYDPVKEAGLLINNYEIGPGDIVVVYGAGLGYHIAEILDRVGKNGRVYIFQIGYQVFECLKKISNLEDIVTDSRVTTIVEDDVSPLSGRLALVLGDCGNEGIKLVVHRPSLELLPVSANDFRAVLEDWEVKRATYSRFSVQMEENLRDNTGMCRGLPGISRLFNRFDNVPVVLVAAGPSLDAAIPDLKRFRNENKGMIVSVGVVLKTLLEQDIKPHLAVLTDPQEHVKVQVAGLRTDVPLIIFPTVHPEVLRAYPGPKILAVPNDSSAAEKLGIGDEATVETGGSVATTMLDIVIKMGTNPVIFVGQDLGFPGGQLHTTSYVHGKVIMEQGMLLRQVMGNNGKILSTSRALDIYRKWIEERISREEQKTFFNTALEGAVIRGTKVVQFLKIIGELPQRNDDFELIIREG